MGDALSPAMTVGTCAWMEHAWMQTLTAETKARFTAKRYMDDVILFYIKHGWNVDRFLSDFKESEC